jgi:uncharacterized damage-inducible protein DinB
VTDMLGGGPDPRTDPPGRGDERAVLTGFLTYQRDTLELKCRGLGPEELARRAVEPSALSLLGLVRHLADVERSWFRRVIAGQDAPPIFYTPDALNDDFDGAAAEQALADEAWARWREEVAFADEVTAATSLDATGTTRRGDEVSLRWVLTHMIEEYARHNGHADLLRERIDGQVGE